MKLRQQLIAAAALALLGLAAGAQTPPQPAVVAPRAAAAPNAAPMGGRPMMQEHMARMQEHRAQRQAALKQILQITPAQENAWNTWIASRRPADVQRPAPGAWAQLSTPERIDRMRALRAARTAEMDRRGEATKAFYAALTPPQQKAFDALALQRGGRGRHGGWGPHHG
ncbi:Spy/CpxP family protein refolding chaperone [Ramlibacter sp.]|uniref:Spy/CpxP family protein refolding chaperone n=1 Tax=Ramlibacter sp. TaxID=1917967 RepID=UPI002B5E67F5|nr:Spy/CpxP family protein refolding chaperone [Ramlibacter sp.]HWI83519.1 Spy/CpxP family protein refolding chaperone [Ramlibacter sp.]